MDPAIIQSRGLAVNNIGPGALLEGTLRFVYNNMIQYIPMYLIYASKINIGT